MPWALLRGEVGKWGGNGQFLTIPQVFLNASRTVTAIKMELSDFVKSYVGKFPDCSRRLLEQGRSQIWVIWEVSTGKFVLT